jgi:hypothetical protein
MAHLIRTHFLLILLIVSIVSTTGCGMARNTLAQDLAWEQWYQCDRFPEIELKEIRLDGQIWVWNRGGHLSEWRQCIQKAREEQARKGVAIGRSIIEAHGGRLWATPNAMHGATFYFSLPVDAGGPDGGAAPDQGRVEPLHLTP